MCYALTLHVFIFQKIATLKRLLGKTDCAGTGGSKVHSNSLKNHENDGEERDMHLAEETTKKRPPLIKDDSLDIMSSTLLTDAVESVAVDWKSFRNIKQCVCDNPFEHFSRKVCDKYWFTVIFSF